MCLCTVTSNQKTKMERKGQKRKVKPEMRIFMGAKSVTFKLETALRDLN